MSYIFTKGATSQSIELYIIDSTDGTPETGVLWNTAGIDLKYRRKDAVVVSITEAALTTPALTDTWESGGFLEIGNGVYRLDLPDAALASAVGIDRVVVFGTVTGMVVLPVTIHLTAVDLNDAVRGGLTALPNANADAAGGLVISDAGAQDFDAMNTAAVAVDTLTKAAGNGDLAAVLVDTAEIGAAVGASISADVAAVKAETVSIVADTNELQTDDIPGALSTHDGKLDTVDGIVDNILVDTAEIGAAVGASLSADIAAVKAETVSIVADTNELQVDDYPTSIAAVKTVVDAIKVITDALTAAAAAKLALSAGTIVAGTVSHDNTAASTTVFYCDDITEATADHYKGRIVIFTSGALIYQATDITAYALDTGEGKFTVTALTEAPADNVTFVIV